MNFVCPFAHIIFIKLFDFWVFIYAILLLFRLLYILYLLYIICIVLWLTVCRTGDGIMSTQSPSKFYGNGEEDYLSGKDMICNHYSEVILWKADMDGVKLGFALRFKARDKNIIKFDVLRNLFTFKFWWILLKLIVL